MRRERGGNDGGLGGDGVGADREKEVACEVKGYEMSFNICNQTLGFRHGFMEW